jgi:hypothetical protein
MNAQALEAALMGATMGAAVCYLAIKRGWWAASGMLAMGAAVLLAIVTQGHISHLGHSVVFYVAMGLILWFAIAFFMHQARVRRRSGSRD